MKPLLIVSSILMGCLVGVNGSPTMYSTLPKIEDVFPSLYRNTRVLKDHRLPSASVNDGELAGMIRTQSARMAEISLASKSQEELRCFKRTLCIVGATMNNARENPESRTLNPTTLAKGVDQFRQILEMMVEDISNNQQERMEDYPNVHQVLGSHLAGSSTRDLSMCQKLFPCSTSAADFNLGGASASAESRAGCGAVNAICPGVAIGCSLCSVYAPGTCGDQCIIAGIYCGTSALACAHDAKVEEAKKNEKKNMSNEEIVRQTYRKYLF